MAMGEYHEKMDVTGCERDTMRYDIHNMFITLSYIQFPAGFGRVSAAPFFFAAGMSSGENRRSALGKFISSVRPVGCCFVAQIEAHEHV